MREFYEPCRKRHDKRLADAAKDGYDSYTLSDFEDNGDIRPYSKRNREKRGGKRKMCDVEYNVVAEPPDRPSKRARRSFKRQQAIRADNKPPKKSERALNNEKIRRSKTNKPVTINENEDEEESEAEAVTSNSSDELWLPNQKERMKMKRKRTVGLKPKQVINPKSSNRSFFERTVENDAALTRKSSATPEMAACREFRGKFLNFLKRHNNSPVDEIDLFLDCSDGDSDISLDDETSAVGSIFVKNPFGKGILRKIPSLQKLMTLIPRDLKPEDPLPLLRFRIQHGLFDKNLETAPNQEKECVRRWRILEAMTKNGFLDNLLTFDVPP